MRVNIVNIIIVICVFLISDDLFSDLIVSNEMLNNTSLGPWTSGGGHEKALKFKSCALKYVPYLKELSEEERKMFELNITSEELVKIVNDESIKYKFFKNSEEFVIDDRTLVKDGVIFSNGEKKHAYYLSSKRTIYVSKTWDETKESVPLKEYLRVLDKTTQAYLFFAWYDNFCGSKALQETLNKNESFIFEGCGKRDLEGMLSELKYRKDLGAIMTKFIESEEDFKLTSIWIRGNGKKPIITIEVYLKR